MKATEDDFLFDIQLTALFHGDEKIRRSAMELNGLMLDYKNAREKKEFDNAKNKSGKLQD